MELNINTNNLISLSISQNVNLEILNCSNNSLTSLLVNQNSLLAQLQCQDNQLGALNLLGNPNLQILLYNDNNLAGLNPSLLPFNASNNVLSQLDIRNGNNTAITTANFSVLNNPSLACIEVDDETYTTANWTNKEAQTFYGENCATLSIEEFEPNTYIAYPNPARDRVNITTTIQNADYRILSIKGQVVKKGILGSGDTILNIEKLASGLYLLNIKTTNGYVI